MTKSRPNHKIRVPNTHTLQTKQPKKDNHLPPHLRTQPKTTMGKDRELTMYKYGERYKDRFRVKEREREGDLVCVYVYMFACVCSPLASRNH